MMKLVRRVVAIMALWAGILGMFLGFGLWLYPKNTAMDSPELALPIIAGGLIAWWLGCRLAIAAPRRVRHDQAGRQVVAGQGNVLDPPAVVLQR